MKLVLILSLVFISYQDIKERKVFLLNLLLSGFLLSFTFYSSSFLWEIYLKEILINTMLVSILILVLWLYTKFKMKLKLTEAIGLGDLIFFYVLALGFPTLSFVVIFCTSIIFSQILFLILSFVKELKTVPLAGFQAFFLTIIIIVNSTFGIVDLYAM